MNDRDAIWKPGYDGPPPIVGAIDEPAEDETVDAPAAPSQRWRVGLVVAALVALGLVLVAAVVVLDPLGSGDDAGVDGELRPVAEIPTIDIPDSSVFGGPAARRLPNDAAMLWSVDIGHDGDHWVEVVRRDLVVVAIVESTDADGDTNASVALTTSVVALDATTGEERWTLRLAGRPQDMGVVGAIDDVVVVEQPGVEGPIVVGVDIDDGVVRWSSEAGPNDGHVGLAGTALIARLPVSADGAVSLIDARSGRDVGAIASDPMDMGRPAGWSTNGEGTWFVADDGEVVAYDLREGLGEATVIAEDVEVTRPPLVVAGRLAVVDDVGSLTFAGVDTGGPVAVSGEVPTRVRSLTPVSDASFVVAAPRTVSGVAVEGDEANVTWQRREGVIVDHHPVVGGSLIHLATQGGGANQLIDGRTGETVEHLTMTPGALQALVVAGDGVVVVRAAAIGGRLAGIDLDGTERWSILGSAPVLAGDRIVVRATTSESSGANASSQQLRITAYGDDE